MDLPDIFHGMKITIKIPPISSKRAYHFHTLDIQAFPSGHKNIVGTSHPYKLSRCLLRKSAHLRLRELVNQTKLNYDDNITNKCVFRPEC